MVRYAIYYSTFKEEKSNFFIKLADYLPKDSELTVVYRYRYRFIGDKDMAKLKSFILYENFRKLDDKEIAKAESLMEIPFASIVLLSKVALLRYPNMKALPDDEYLANCAVAWERFFRENRIEVFIAGLIDEPPGLVGLEVAKRLGITIVMVHGGRFSRSLYMADKDYRPIFWKKLSEKQIDEAYEKAYREVYGSEIINPEMVKITGSFFNMGRIDTLIKLALALPRNFYSYYFKLPKCDRKIWYSTGELVVRQLKYFIRSSMCGLYFNKKIVPEERYVFFPMHYTEDATLTAKFGIDNQFNIIEKIASVLPHGMWLYIKPHPHWRCCDVELGKMRRLSKIPKVRLLPPTASTRQLVQNAEFTAVINSSVAVECFLAKKAVVGFGNDYPEDIIPKVTDAIGIFDAAKNRQPSPEKLREYVANLYSHSIFVDQSYIKTTCYEVDVDVKNVADAIVEAHKFLESRGKK